MPLPLLVVVVSWLAVILVSFGLFVSPNSTVVVALALGAIAVSSAVFIILEMYKPFSGILRISPIPILDALKVRWGAEADRDTKSFLQNGVPSKEARSSVAK